MSAVCACVCVLGACTGVLYVSRVSVCKFSMFAVSGMCVSVGCVRLPVGHVCGMCEFCVCMCGVSASEFCMSVVRVCHQGVCVRPMYVSARL